MIGSLLALLLAQAAPAAASPEWVTLGTAGGSAVQPERSQIANALVVGDAVYLFDTGNGVQAQLARAHIPERQVRAVFVSHHHLDHNADLGPVIVTHWTFGRGVLPIYGPAGTKTLVDGLVAANAPTTLAGYPTAGKGPGPLAATVTGADIAAAADRGVPVYADDRIRVTAMLVDHYQSRPSIPLPAMPQAVAYRVEVAGRSIVYTGDAGPTPALAGFARDSDLLVSEVVDPDALDHSLTRAMPDMPVAVKTAIVAGMRINHLTADAVGRLAAASGARALVLTHFVPVPEAMARPAALTEAIGGRYKGKVTMARDLDRFRL